jgi:hypothetical protein
MSRNTLGSIFGKVLLKTAKNLVKEHKKSVAAKTPPAQKSRPITTAKQSQAADTAYKTPSEEQKERFRKENGYPSRKENSYIYRPQDNPATGIVGVVDRPFQKRAVNGSDPNGFGLRKTPSGKYKKTRNTYIEDELEYVLLEPKDTITFHYTNLKGGQRWHSTKVKYITGSKHEVATHMIGDYAHFLEKMTQVTSELTGRTHADGFDWLKSITSA